MAPFAGANVTTSADFTDAASITAANREAVDVLAALRVIEGGPDGSYRPQDTVTRAEAVTIITRLLLRRVGSDSLPAAATGFSDVPANHWASRYVSFAITRGIVAGFPDGTFRPELPVTASQFASMIFDSKRDIIP
jgi:hypothetical protein